VVARSTGDEHHASAAAHNGQVGAEATESDLVSVKIDASSHGVDNRLGLLVNLFLHKGVKLALHDGGDLELESLDGTSGGDLAGGLVSLLFTPDAVDVQFTMGNMSNIIILKVRTRLVCSTMAAASEAMKNSMGWGRPSSDMNARLWVRRTLGLAEGTARRELGEFGGTRSDN
jgi:hypothetical protein